MEYESKWDKNHFLYDGILIEVGNSKSDTHQHISVDELKYLTQELSKFRDLVSPEKV